MLAGATEIEKTLRGKRQNVIILSLINSSALVLKLHIFHLHLKQAFVMWRFLLYYIIVYKQTHSYGLMIFILINVGKT